MAAISGKAFREKQLSRFIATMGRSYEGITNGNNWAAEQPESVEVVMAAIAIIKLVTTTAIVGRMLGKAFPQKKPTKSLVAKRRSSSQEASSNTEFSLHKPG